MFKKLVTEVGAVAKNVNNVNANLELVIFFEHNFHFFVYFSF